MYTKKTILIADDEQFNYELIKRVINKIGKPKIICVETGAEVIEMCRLHPEIDLILMDLQMPFGNGYETIKIVKQLLPKVPVIAITAFVIADSKRMALEAGFDMYLSKPIKFELLNLILEKYLS